jgi:transposase
MENIIGVDVGKKELALHYDGANYLIANREETLQKFMNKHPQSKKGLWVFEPTGGYERMIKIFLKSQAIAYHQVHATRVREYAKSRGILAKTDKIDAGVLAAYAKERDLVAQNDKQEGDETIQVLSRRREQLIQMLRQEKNRLALVTHQATRGSIQTHIEWIEEQIKLIEKELQDYVKKNSQIKSKIALYQSVPGVGKVTAWQLIAHLPELETLEIKPLTALVGIAPMNHESGSIRKPRHICGGRQSVRQVLYMAAVSTIRCSPLMKTFYQRLISRGKCSKVALVAVMHKLLNILRSIAQRGTPWVDQLV